MGGNGFPLSSSNGLPLESVGPNATCGAVFTYGAGGILRVTSDFNRYVPLDTHPEVGVGQLPAVPVCVTRM